MVVLPEIEGLATLVAVIVTACVAEIEAGAVYSPVPLMEPAPLGLIDHVTPAVPALDVVAVNC